MLTVALCLGAVSSAFAQDQPSSSPNSPAASSGASPMVLPMPGHIDWSNRYQFTPLEQKRLEAMGLSKQECWAVAKAARESGRDVSDVAQMVLRGRTYFQIADDLGVPYPSLFRWPARWQTPQWEEEVRAGSPVWVPAPGDTTQENRSDMQGSPGQTRERRGRRGGQSGMAPGAERVSAPTCPVCHMQLTTVASASNPKAVTIEGKTYYCCAGCDMSKTQ
jgi:hypothetical protein